jgi:hypothetical protein
MRSRFPYNYLQQCDRTSNPTTQNHAIALLIQLLKIMRSHFQSKPLKNMRSHFQFNHLKSCDRTSNPTTQNHAIAPPIQRLKTMRSRF